MSCSQARRGAVDTWACLTPCSQQLLYICHCHCNSACFQHTAFSSCSNYSSSSSSSSSLAPSNRGSGRPRAAPAQSTLTPRPTRNAAALRHPRRVQRTISLPQHRRGCHIITGKIYEAVPEISEYEVR